VSAVRRIAAGAILVAGLALGTSARAEPFSMTDEFGAEINPQPGSHYHSPKYLTVQLMFGPYRPNIDSEFSGQPFHRTPYADYFGNDRHLLMQVEAAYEVWQKVGTISAGLSAGYFSVDGPAPAADRSATLTADKSTLKIVPVSLSAIYRFDYYLVRDDFPIVPHVKVGLDWDYWQITDGNGQIATDSMGGKGRGGTLGWHAAAGVALVLDKLDPDAAKQFDVEMGVNHSALVFEYGHYGVSGLGTSDRLHVGDTTWTLGLMFEF
jgi:hypothetical protein